MKTLIIFLIATGLSVIGAYAGETVSGAPTVLNATTMTVNNQPVELDNIISLKPGNDCKWKNRPLDCGVLASAGLKDLVAGSDVVCKQNVSGKYTCTAGGYDLAYGLIHAGWAVPKPTAPAHYFAKMNRAKSRNLGFWGAVTATNEIVAVRLMSR